MISPWHQPVSLDRKFGPTS